LYATLTAGRSSIAFHKDPDELPLMTVAFTHILGATLTAIPTSTRPILTIKFRTDTGPRSWILTTSTREVYANVSNDNVLRHWHIALLDITDMMEHESDGGRLSATFDKNAPLSLHLQNVSMSTDATAAAEKQPTGPLSTKSARGKGAKMAQLDHVGPCLSHALSQFLSAGEATSTAETEVEAGGVRNLDAANETESTPALPQLQTQDFSEKCKISSVHPPSGQTYDFRAYAPQAFQRMRELSGVTNASFATSMEKLSGGAVGEGKSGMVFFRSKDNRFITKTLKNSEKDFFYHRGVLEAYYKYMQANPETLLCSFFGLFKIRFSPRDGWIVVIVMENAFNTTLELHEKYDLKGSTKNRFVTEEEQVAGCSVLKDLNFTSKLSLDEPDADILLRQVEKDVAFLGKYNMMDYSLLLGVHKRSRTRRGEGEGESKSSTSAAVAPPPSDFRVTRWRKDDGGIEGRSAVPTQRNETYFISIIDFLQLYDASKKMENALKGRILGHEREVSAVSGIKYADRFFHYVKTITECVSGVPSEAQKIEMVMENDKRAHADALAKKAAEDDHQRKSETEKAQIKEASMQASFLVKLRVRSLCVCVCVCVCVCSV
jgi:1-phosphatidylinositol-4-phosphate 5-kinase